MAAQKFEGRRVAIVAGLRTPFVKASSVFAELSALDLGKAVVNELVQRAEVDPQQIDQVVFGTVIPTLLATSIAREVVIASGLPPRIDAHTVARACATSIQAFTDAASSIALGLSHIAVVGGTESMSDPPIYTSRPLAHALVQASRARTLREKVRPFQTLKPKDLLPVPPAIVEHSTGLSMGESAEKMAKENGITRAQQDEIAFASHVNAAAAWNEGFFSDWVMPLAVAPKYEPTVEKDNLFRADASMHALGELLPVFDKKFGTVTAGNSSPLTDGAAALLVMSEESAKRLNMRPLGFLRSFAYAATNPAEQLLQGPAYAAPLALDRAGMTLKDIDIFEMHEAFAAQVASNLQAFASPTFAQKIGRAAPLGEVDGNKLNLAGGSLALGHPFAATGARLIYQALKLLQKKDKTTALVTACAQGGLGAAVVLERV